MCIFILQLNYSNKRSQNSLLGIQPIHCEHSENQQQAIWCPGRLHIAGLVPKIFSPQKAEMEIDPAVFVHKKGTLNICQEILKQNKKFDCNTNYNVHFPNIGILVGSEESRCLLCSAHDETQGKGGKLYLVLHTSRWPGRMVHTHWSSIHNLVTVVRHNVNSFPPPLFEPRWGGGNRGKHSGQDRYLMIQDRPCQKGHSFKLY